MPTRIDEPGCPRQLHSVRAFVDTARCQQPTFLITLAGQPTTVTSVCNVRDHDAPAPTTAHAPNRPAGNDDRARAHERIRRQVTFPVR